ncbi:Magnesium transporter MgtE [bioreactor metagenome]|uniref:Magnesium transporter MgtE n=1 Tax=bioreactor metagenome TaxID=1076179 RepID=A0A644X9R0_9ZZZZ
MEENNFNLQDTLTALVESKKYSALRDILTTMNPADIAAIFSYLAKEKLPLLFRLLPKELAAETFVEMDSDAQELLIRGFSDNELKEVVNELYVDDAVDIVEEMPAGVVKRVLRQADPDMRKMINEILQYPEDSAGSIMTTEFVDLQPQMSVKEAMLHIRRTGVDKETIYTCYITDKNRKLIGMVSIRTLLLADEEDLLESIMETHVISVNTLEDQEMVAKALGKYDFIAMPVVDREGRLVGIITVDDAIDVLQEEVTEDIEKMAAITPSDKPYLKTSTIEIWQKRVPWLLILMISATFTGIIITSFQDALAAQVVLSAYIPMLMDTGGNSGSQSSVTIIRGISLGEIKFGDMPIVIWKEVRVAFLCGLTLAVSNFAKLMLFDRVSLSVTLVVCITLVVTVLVAKVVGCALPLLANQIGFDPAVMASPFLTTIVDAISLLIYFQTATFLLHL